ncbi:MAG: hypothetical protein IJF90_06205 [Synergistaceae bacterium]|nr:hypothetical protein [Synergistaceae bacterium]
MQLEWATFVDYLEREGRITARQRDTWNNPTTPENFRRWNRLNFGCYPDKN